MNTELAVIRQEAFDGINLSVIEHQGEEWFTASDIAKAIGYENSEKVHQVYRRYRDEFDGLSTAFNLKGVDGRTRHHRVFNLQGCQLIGFFARTTRGKLFRRWASHLLAHGIHKMRAQIEKCQDEIEKCHSIIEGIDVTYEVRERSYQDKIKWLQNKLAKLRALPAPASPNLPKMTKPVLVDFQELRKLYEFAQTKGAGLPYDWLHKVLDRNGEIPTFTLEVRLPGAHHRSPLMTFEGICEPKMLPMTPH